MAKKYTVHTAHGEMIQVEADTVIEDDSAAKTTFFLNDEVVAAFRGLNGFFVTPTDTPAVPAPPSL